MTPVQLEALLAYFTGDIQLQTLLGAVTGDTKWGYAVLPPCYPSVTFWDTETQTPRAGYDSTGVSENAVNLAINSWTHDEGVVIGTTKYSAISLQRAIAARVGVLAKHIETSTALTAVFDSLNVVSFDARPLPFEEDTHVHHTLCLLKFTHVSIESL